MLVRDGRGQWEGDMQEGEKGQKEDNAITKRYSMPVSGEVRRLVRRHRAYRLLQRSVGGRG